MTTRFPRRYSSANHHHWYGDHCHVQRSLRSTRETGALPRHRCPSARGHGYCSQTSQQDAPDRPRPAFTAPQIPGQSARQPRRISVGITKFMPCQPCSTFELPPEPRKQSAKPPMRACRVGRPHETHTNPKTPPSPLVADPASRLSRDSIQGHHMPVDLTAYD